MRLFVRQGKYPEAEALYGQSQPMWEKVPGPGYPSVALSLNNRAFVLHLQVRLIRDHGFKVDWGALCGNE